MNCCWIILLLLFCGQNGNCGSSRNGNCGSRQNRNGGDEQNRDGRSGQNGCGCGESSRQTQPRRGQDQESSCPREESRFEPRFEQRPFNGNGSTCGCEAENN